MISTAKATATFTFTTFTTSTSIIHSSISTTTISTTATTSTNNTTFIAAARLLKAFADVVIKCDSCIGSLFSRDIYGRYLGVRIEDQV